ncbi:hypothetical protein JXQ31_04055 [candidate division KSB1 bacterium]|nr:hypothetical protein [candidate division KSB1 bacterium]
MRPDHIIYDILTSFTALFEQFKSDTAPFKDWQIVREYPAATVLDNMTKPIIYLKAPILTGRRYYQGGRCGLDFEIVIGFHNDKTTGGAEERAIAESAVLNLLNDSKAVHTKSFDVQFGNTVYPEQTLTLQGIRVSEVTGPFREVDEKEDEFNSEFRVKLQT